MKNGSKGIHFTADWENKEKFAKLIMSVIQFSRFYHDVVINRHQSELEQKEKVVQEAMEALGAASSRSTTPAPDVAFETAFRSTIVNVENNKAIVELQAETTINSNLETIREATKKSERDSN